VVLAVAVCVFAAFFRQDAKLRMVWRPLLDSPSPIVISVLEQAPDQLTEAANDASHSLNVNEHQRLVSSIHFSEVQALVRIINFLADHRHAYRLQTAKATTYSDLQQGPAILIGAIGNPWTLRALQPLRYRFARDDEHLLYWVEDQKYTQSRKWTHNMSQPYSALNQDFAIVARFVDPETRQPVIILAGIGENGTRAASEFLTDREDMRDVDDSILRTKSNFEIVIRTQVINGVSGPPQIVAAETW
jgi:hypothetical protein